MDVLLQKHGAKHIYKVPEGLRELCTDIAREVLRSQPRNIYCFVADYVETLLITRENAKVAVKVVNNILLGSQAIVDILHRSGLSLEQISLVAPRIQEAFRAYLDAVDTRAAQVCDDATCDERTVVSLQSILRATGVSLEQAEKHATIIQAAFRGHYERMLLNESRGIIQWQRSAVKTLEILRKAGVSQAEASKAAILIQATYRGYYTRKRLKMKMQEEKRSEVDMIEPREAVQAVDWLDTMYEESGLTLKRANEAATIIQKAYRRYREKSVSKPPVESTKSTEAEAILKNLHQKVFDEVMARADIPMEFDNREDLTKAEEGEFDEEFVLVKLMDDMDSIDVAEEDWQKDREIKEEPKRDEETDTYVQD